jgi:hypothetical protein
VEKEEEEEEEERKEQTMKRRREKKKAAERNPKKSKKNKTLNRKTGINTLTEKHASVRGKNEMHIIIFLYYLESDKCA